MYQVQATDLILSHNAYGEIRDRLDYDRSNGRSGIQSYAKGLDLSVVPSGFGYITTTEQAEVYSNYIVRLHKHAEYITQHPEVFLPVANDSNARVVAKHAGIQSTWSLDDNIGTWLRIKRDVVDTMLDGIATSTNDSGDSTIVFNFNDERLSESYIGHSEKPMLQRALWFAKRKRMLNVMTTSGVDIGHSRDDSKQLYIALSNRADGFTTGQVNSIRRIAEVYNNLKVRPDELNQYRREVLNIQVQQLRNDENIRRQLASKQFSVYWDSMKQRQRSLVPDYDTLEAEYATIPLAPKGTAASRTWGIEVETVRANETSRPAGWTDVYDGSLPDGGCECSCDSCCDGDHCDDVDYCASGTESREFVSPILSSFNSDGLRKLCNDLGDDEDSTAPGIHVHVGADDLTVTDIARLLFAYGAVAPFITPLYHRESFGYCHEMEGNNVQWWLSAVKSWLRTSGVIPNPRDICEQQPASRYQDVNLHSLTKHGTIEFRSMGPFYNYDHLVRWAWFVREMVNVSKLGLDQRVWTACKSLADVIDLLRKYGSEQPVSQDINNNDLVLAYEN